MVWIFAVFSVVDKINYTYSFKLPCPHSLIHCWDFASGFAAVVVVILGHFGFNWKKHCKLQTDIFLMKWQGKHKAIQSWQNEIEKGNYSLKL